MTPIRSHSPDILVIGGGPAGTSSAIRLARSGRQVRLYEKKRFPRPKLCGGFLSAEGMQDLDELDVLKDLQRLGAMTMRRSVIASTHGTILESALSGPALSVSREVMDDLLWEQAKRAGVDVREEDGWADPANGLTRVVAAGRQINPTAVGQTPEHRHPWYATSPTAYVGLQALFEDVDGVSDQVELDLIHTGYVGLARVDARRVNVCTLTTLSWVKQSGPDLDRVMAGFVQENPVLRGHLRTARRVTPWLSVGPVRLGIRQLAKENTFYVGDAACVIDPFAGEGMSVALYSSRLLLAALDQKAVAPAVAYERLWKQAFLPALRWNALLRFFYTVRPFREPVLHLLRSIPRAMTGITELTRHRCVELD